MSIRLRVQSPHAAAADYDLEGPEIIIGRAESAAIVLADSRVSRRHARLILRDGGWWVEDLGARNHALLNGEPVTAAAPVRAGDRLAVGDSILRIIGDAEAAPDLQPDLSSRTLTHSEGAGSDGVGRDAARMWTLNQIHRALAGPLSLPELLAVILDRCFDVLEPEEGVVLLRADDGTLSTAASRRHGRTGAAVTVPRRLVDEVVGKRQPALVLDAAYDDRFAGSASMISSGIRSIVAAPMVDGEGTLGLIALCSRVVARRFTPADLDMLVSIASAAALRVRNVALADELATRRVVEHELALAHDVQKAMLPGALAARPDLSLAAHLTPARSVGGDLYDYVLDGERLWFIVAGVTGKSIAAALYMAITRTLFRVMARGDAAVPEVAARMNRELARDNTSLMFVTASIGCLDLSSGVVTLVDAGHTPAVLIDAGGGAQAPAVEKGVALGVVEDATYVAARVGLASSATLLMYTDGVTDARAASGEMFGSERLDAAIAAAPGGEPAVLVGGIVGALERFTAGEPPEDDITVLAFRYDPARRSGAVSAK
ncbi:MAG: SpoIIE family protein phosphatase [Vicinamibacterales bacterium]